MIYTLLSSAIRKAVDLYHLQSALCHTEPKVDLCHCNRRCRQMHQYAQKSTQDGARNSNEDGACDAPRGTAQHQPLLAHQRPWHKLSSRGRCNTAALELPDMPRAPQREQSRGNGLPASPEGEHWLRSCRRRWEVCKALEIMEKRI